MSSHDPRAFTRRAFLHRGLMLASSAVTVPYFVDASAAALAQGIGAGLAASAAPASERILVVVQLAGGNDGLNTVVPFGQAAYYNARPGIAIPQREALALARSGRADGLGLHPRLAPLKEMYDEGELTIVQGVGYPNPNRSHFKSMDIWHTGETSGTGDGWIGRYFDNQCAGAPDGCGHGGIAIGRDAPLAMQGRHFRPMSFESADLFRWTGLDGGDDEARAYRALTQGPARAGIDPASSEAFLTRTALDAQVASDRIRAAVARAPLAAYPRSRLAQQLAMVAAMIRGGLSTRVYYVSHGGFDTHAGQGGVAGAHANLLQQFGEAVRAFHRDLRASGDDGRVLTMSFSEFGRRVAQNGSGGTDHGAAAPVFLCGAAVRPGVLGDHPSLTDLDNGDLRYGVDFRSVYAGVLADWLRADPVKVLGRRFEPARLLRAPAGGAGRRAR